MDKTKADVLKVLKDLNIQLDNLCQVSLPSPYTQALFILLLAGYTFCRVAFEALWPHLRSQDAL